ncbi:hypothetical protein [uncultured Jannaschia sp.]|uniref:hypothetical protein n=1 Tax=uncultured Jannaschia sp. TaxID=293347 RepID=UPI002621EB0F|nr:hypothetical protein [uncultured Jannaschia sp.]
MKDPYTKTPFWRPSVAECEALRTHLLAELPVGHALWPPSDRLQVIARDRNGDRIVVRTGIAVTPVALVHMSWAGRPPMAPFLPETEFYASDEELIAAVHDAPAPNGARRA